MAFNPRSPQATYEDVSLLLRLYEIRREERMREARRWFVANYRAASYEEAKALLPVGSEENASFRMMVSYWDMVASYIKAGVLNQELFFEGNRELLLVWVRVKPTIAEVREAFADPFYLHNLETVGEAYAAWLDDRAAGSFDAFAKRIG